MMSGKFVKAERVDIIRVALQDAVVPDESHTIRYEYWSLDGELLAAPGMYYQEEPSDKTSEEVVRKAVDNAGKVE